MGVLNTFLSPSSCIGYALLALGCGQLRDDLSFAPSIVVRSSLLFFFGGFKLGTACSVVSRGTWYKFGVDLPKGALPFPMGVCTNLCISIHRFIGTCGIRQRHWRRYLLLFRT